MKNPIVIVDSWFDQQVRGATDPELTESLVSKLTLKRQLSALGTEDAELVAAAFLAEHASDHDSASDREVSR